MYARSTTLRGNPDAIEQGIAYARDEVLPAVTSMEGCTGMSMLIDRETGWSIVTTAWRDLESMRATEPSVGPMRDRAQQLTGARPEVREWEIAVLHRRRSAPEGACARVTWTHVPPHQIEQQLSIFRDGTLPQMEDLPGFCSASLMIDADAGDAVLAVAYENADELARSREPAAELRTASVDRMGARIVDVAEFEVAFAHLRVPETV